jgi:hypothetical protein
VRSPLGHDVDDAAKRAGAVDAALRPAQHFDALDVGRQQGREVEIAGVERVHLHTIEDDLDLIALRAADADLRHRAGAPGPVHREAGNHAQGVGRMADLPALSSAPVITVALAPRLSASTGSP